MKCDLQVLENFPQGIGAQTQGRLLWSHSSLPFSPGSPGAPAGPGEPGCPGVPMTPISPLGPVARWKDGERRWQTPRDGQEQDQARRCPASTRVGHLPGNPGSPGVPCCPGRPGSPDCPVRPGSPCSPLSPLGPGMSRPGNPGKPFSPFTPGGPVQGRASRHQQGDRVSAVTVPCLTITSCGRRVSTLTSGAGRLPPPQTGVSEAVGGETAP